MNTMGLRHKLILSLFLIFLPNLLILVYGLRYLNHLEHRLNLVNNNLTPSLRLLQKFEKELEVAHQTLNLRFFATVTGTDIPQPWPTHLMQIKKHLQLVAAENPTAGNMLSRIDGLLAAVESKDTRKLLEEVPLVARWFEREIATESLLIQKELRTSLDRLIIIAALSALLSGLLVYFVHYHMKRFSTLVNAIKNVGRGVYTTFYDQNRPLHKKSSDELDTLTREFDSMVRKLEKREHTLLESERLAAIGRMSAQVAHEIRNPLNAMSLNLEMLSEDLPQDNPAKKTIRLLLDEVSRLERLTEDYLRNSQIEPELPPDEGSQISVSQALEEANHLFKESLGQNEIDLRMVNPELGRAALRSRDQMIPIIINLLRNSNQAIRKKGNIEVGLESRDNRLVLYVEDSGPGIPIELRKRVLQPYFSLNKKGSGLGFSIIQNYLKNMGGNLTIRDPRNLPGIRIECDLGTS